MQLGQVIGTATSTVKHPSLNGWKLLVVQPLMADEKSSDGEPQLVIDSYGAGRGERVLITNDSKMVSAMLKDEKTPVRWCVMGIAD